MLRDRRGKVKEPLWTQPTCLDREDSLHLRRAARHDFWRHCREEGELSAIVFSPDVLAEYDEFWRGEHPFMTED